ncbi:MAG: hypothetical protein KGZ40_02805 [Clostridiales bacterium]|nr:hypothetical protein [Clostridiales bacterium]
MVAQSSLSNVDVIVYALADLGGTVTQVAHEALAYRAFELAPDRFSWTLPEYRHLPDKDIARVALVDASRDKCGSLVIGSVKAGYWRLTPAGVKWFAVHGDKVAARLGRSAPSSSGRPNDVKRIVSRTKKHYVFKEFQAGRLEELPAAAFADMLGCSPDASSKVMRSRLDALESAAEASNEIELKDMVTALVERFASLLHGGGSDEAR